MKIKLNKIKILGVFNLSREEKQLKPAIFCIFGENFDEIKTDDDARYG